MKIKCLFPGNFFTCDDQKSSRSDNKNYEEVSAFVLSHFYLGFIMITSLCLRDILEMLSRWTSACKPTTLVMWPGVNICLLIFPSRPVLKNKIKTFWLRAVSKTNITQASILLLSLHVLNRSQSEETIYSSFTRLQFETR